MFYSYNSPLFELRLGKYEYKYFMNILPLLDISADESEKSKALSIIGIDNELIFDLLANHDESLLNCFRIVLFALTLKDHPKELAAFITRISFCDRGFERRFLSMVRDSLREHKLAISADELNAMWKLDSSVDDGGKPI